MRRNIRICPHTTKRAFAISRDAAALGFDWPTAADVVDKLQEEVDEIRDALAKPQYDGHLADEIGDLFFALVNLARKAGIPPEDAFKRGVDKFDRRFRAIKRLALARHLRLQSLDANELDALWRHVKLEESLP